MTPATDSGPQLHRRRTWPLIVSVVAVIVTSFLFSYHFGHVYVNRTQNIPFTDGFSLTMAIWWAIATYRKNASPRVRKWSLAGVLLLVALVAVASFGAGKRDGYPDQARNLVEELQSHAREVKKIKAEISEARSTFNQPEDLLTIQPKVVALKEHIDAIDTLMHQVTKYEVLGCALF